jgi:NTE family protein
MLEKLALFVKELYLWNLRAVKKNLVDSVQIEPLIKLLVGDKRFEDTKIPFECIATDLLSGEEVILNKGPLLPALLASSALPGIFPPVEIKGRTLIDGGIVTVVPIDPLRKMGADLVIAVDVDEGAAGSKFDHAMDIMFQADYIRMAELTRVKLLSADLVIKPDVKKISWASFSLAKSCIQKGQQAAEGSVELVKNEIEEKELSSEQGKKRSLWNKLSGFFCRSKI